MASPETTPDPSELITIGNEMALRAPPYGKSRWWSALEDYRDIRGNPRQRTLRPLIQAGDVLARNLYHPESTARWYSAVKELQLPPQTFR